MQKEPKKHLRSWLKRITDSFRGLMVVLYEESSLYMILSIIFIALLIGGLSNAKMSAIDWIIIVIISSLIITIEIINTAIENLVDLVNFKYNLNVKKIKNIAAAGSLVMNIGAIISFIILFTSVLGK